MLGGAPSTCPDACALLDALRHRGDENVDVGGLIQHIIRAGGQGGGHDDHVDSAGHHDDGHVLCGGRARESA